MLKAFCLCRYKMLSKNVFFNIILKLYAILILILSSEESTVCAKRFQTLLTRFHKNKIKLLSLPFEDCGSLYDIYFLNISSCGSIPCEMARGSTVMVNVIFDDYGNDTKFLKHRVRWIFNGIKTNALITPDPCDGNDNCITQINDGKSYWSQVFVNNNLPILRGTMFWEALDEDQQQVICFKVPVIIYV